MSVKTILKKRYFWMLLLSSIILFFSYLQYRNYPPEVQLDNSGQKIQTKLLQKEKSLFRQVNQLSAVAPLFSSKTTLPNSGSYVEPFEKNGNAFFVFKDSLLIYWSSNRVPVASIFDSALFSKPLVQLLNGWYLKSSKAQGKYTVVGLSLVKNNFMFENVYLENSFASDFNVNPSIQLQITQGEHNIFDSQKRFLFSLFLDEDKANSDTPILLMIFSLFLLFLVLVHGLYLLISELYPNRISIYFGCVSLVLIGIRFLTFVFNAPLFLYQSKLFSPIYYASSKWLPSLGDLLLNTITLILVILFVKKAIHSFPKSILKTQWIKSIFAFLFVFIQFFGFSILIYLIQSVVLNSSISFNNDSIFNYTYIHYLVFVIIGLWILIFVEISYHFVLNSLQFCKRKRMFWVLFTLLLVLFTIVNYYYLSAYNHLMVFFLGYYFVLYFLMIKQISIQNIWAKIGLLLLFSVFVTQALDSFYSIKEREERLLLAEKLGTQHDPITEYRLDEVSTLIAADSKVKDYARNLKKNEALLLNYLDRTYLNAFTAKYKVSVTTCKPNQILRLQPDNYKIDCAQYFDKKKASAGTPTRFPNLWFMNYLPGQISYLLVITIDHGENERKEEIYIELDSKMYVNDSGYPELLIDKKQRGINKDFSRYSYARFVNNDLVSQYGKYSYSVKLNYYKAFKNAEKFFQFEGYSHLYYPFTGKETIILSKRIPSTLEKSATVSYYFLLYGLILLVISIISFNPIRLLRNKMTFQLRMQMYMIVIILVSFVMIGTVTINYFLTLNQNKNMEIVNEKIHSILIQFEEQLLNNKSGLSDELVSSIDQLVYQLSVRYFADINVYDANGQMIATSRPQMFQQGLMQDKMNSEALGEFNRSSRTLFFHDEYIGKQKYWSVYMPYFSSNGDVMLYINMPYFAKQKELNNEISSYVVTFLSVYLLIIFITIIIALLLARYISRPLLLIKERMSRIQLGDKNEKIAWKSNDEIGKLVEVYNTMVDELRQSAEMLASSQREQAWREMAQQVAHEIKNPLTPMKLTVQMLELTWKRGDPNWEERLSQFSKTLVEQIDTLADIASSFSNFAIMPQGNFTHEDLLEVVKSVMQLHNYPSVVIRLHTQNETECPVFVDKNQLIRVFNNLIKNAVQSFDHQIGEIDITLTNYDEEFWEVTIKDNGSGIPESLKERIFSPNFTTKTSGMGLGLAMVKNIIVDFGGTIWFNSHTGQGTTFYFTIPKRK